MEITLTGSAGSLTFDDSDIVSSNGVRATKTHTGIAGWERLQRHTDFAGTFSVNETLSGKPTYNERLPNDADVSSLVVG